VDRADYTLMLMRSASTRRAQTAEGVPPEDFSRLTRRIRYLAKGLNMDVHIETDAQKQSVTVSARFKSDGKPIAILAKNEHPG
jgi:hypothetical protein